MENVRRFVREPERRYLTDLDVARGLATRIVAADRGRVRRVLLFGSRARGDARPDSDYDLLVVVRDLTASERREYRHRLYALLGGNDVAAEPWVLGDQEFEESKHVVGGLAYPAWKEGVILYEDA